MRTQHRCDRGFTEIAGRLVERDYIEYVSLKNNTSKNIKSNLSIIFRNMSGSLVSGYDLC